MVSAGGARVAERELFADLDECVDASQREDVADIGGSIADLNAGWGRSHAADGDEQAEHSAGKQLYAGEVESDDPGLVGQQDLIDRSSIVSHIEFRRNIMSSESKHCDRTGTVDFQDAILRQSVLLGRTLGGGSIIAGVRHAGCRWQANQRDHR